MSIRPKVKFSIRLAKEGNAPDECEDNFAITLHNGKIALSDGATDAAYSKVWSEILVKAFCDDIYQIDRWLDTAIMRWREFESNIQVANVPWFTLEKLSNGSASTFLGISFDTQQHTGNHIIWKAITSGDTCLFIVQDNKLRVSFPIEMSNEFSNTPFLLRTIFPYNEERLQTITGTVSYDDKCYLMTDALANWFLQSYEHGESPWLQLDVLTDNLTFEGFISKERSKKTIRNDDICLLVIEFGDYAVNE